MRKYTKALRQSRLHLLSLALSFALLFSVLSPHVLAASSPNPDGQNKDNWCWAASSKMLAIHNGGGSGALNTGATVLTDKNGLHSYNGVNYYGGDASTPTADAGQRQLVVHVKGNDKDQTGDNADRETALLKAAYYSGVMAGTKGNGSLSTSDISYLNMDMASSNWVVGNVFKSSGIGHSIVIKSQSSSSKEFYYYDPWDNAHHYFSETGLTQYTITLSSSSGYRVNWFNWCKY